ncbi:MAG TPA: GC-type dockerin domain-anchored protein [Phycisphaerales bacterium]|nr:GC-type dockerin domain-anchored protein [Phycisphaerales bacterium]
MATRRGVPLMAAMAFGALASSAGAQVAYEGGPGLLEGAALRAQPVSGEPAGPAAQLGIVLPAGEQADPTQSALLQRHVAPPGGFPNMSPSIRPRAGADQPAGGWGERYVDQPINCSGDGWFSNNNSNINPYLVFDDFVADGSPLRSVEFYGGAYGGSFDLSAVASIGLEIWTIGAGGDCGWTYNSLVAFDSFTVAELNPQFTCNVSGIYDAYRFTANLASPVALNAGQNYMITIYATLVNPDGSELFVWSDSLASNYNQATSWDRTSGAYGRCSPDMAFRTNPGSSCQENDCSTTCWFSNYFSNYNPYISLDDFTATASGDLRRIQATGGVYDAGSATGTDFSNISGLYIEIYSAYADNGFPCGNFQNGFLGAHVVSLADTTPRFDCTDIFGISHYTFTIEMPAGFALAAGQQYLVGVYGIPVDPNSDELFCWGGTDAVYGFTSWSFNLGSGVQEICHDVDQAFCIDPARPCFADFNGDGAVDTRDVIAFLNAWNAGNLTADMDFNLDTDTRDVIAFLNVWNAGC